MPNDLINIKATATELNEMLSEGYIDKVTQPENDEVHFSVRIGGKNKLLVISASPQNPRMHLSASKKQNLFTPPSFCMFLRRYAQGGTIKSIKILNDDRIIDLSVCKKNEMLDNVTVHIIAELMGRYSNIIVSDESYIIMQALKIIPFEPSTGRIIAPKVKYKFLEQKKLLPGDFKSLENLISENTFSGEEEEKYFLSNISGYSLFTMKILLKKFHETDNHTSKDLLDFFRQFYDICNSKIYSPCLILNDNNEISDFSAITPSSDNIKSISCQSLNEAMEKFYSERDKAERLKYFSKSVWKNIKNKVAKLTKKYELNKIKLSECEKSEEFKLKGELLLANIYKLKYGDKKVLLENYYDNNNLVEIKLDENLYPKQNIGNYFKSYNKLKKAKEIISQQQCDIERDLEYYKSLEKSLEIAQTEDDIRDIEKELNPPQKGTQNRKIRAEKPSSPIRYDINGKKLTVGKNNIQNERITFSESKNDDIWLHVKSAHGSHAILEGNASYDEIRIAAEITAFYSLSSPVKTEIDYTLKKYVKRHPSKKIGLVNYTNYKTLNVLPDKHSEFLIKD